VRGGWRGGATLRGEMVLGFGGGETWEEQGWRPNWERFAERNSVVGRGDDGASVGCGSGEAGGWFSLLLEDEDAGSMGLSVGLLLGTRSERLIQSDSMDAGEHCAGGVQGMVGRVKVWLLCTVSWVERRAVELMLGGSAVLKVTTSSSQESTLGLLIVASLEEWRGRVSGTPWVEWISSSVRSDPG